MSSIARPPDPCLVAIILIVRSRAGPRLVYHYPPSPAIPNPANRHNSRPKPESQQDSSSSTDDDGSSSDEGDGDTGGSTASSKPSKQQGGNRGVTGGDSAATAAAAAAELLATPVKRKTTPVPDRERHSAIGGAQEGLPCDTGEGYKAPWETLLGLPTDVWEKLLSPSRTWHKRRFEVGINDLAFVGWPVFVREDGTWRKKKKKKKKKGNKAASWAGGELAQDSEGDDGSDREDGDEDAPRGPPGPEGMITGERKARAKDGENKPGKAQADSLNGVNDAMTMFNVVFVLNPPVLEYSARIQEKYESVIKKFGKALKWEQGRADYVWNEAQTILNLKERAREKNLPTSSLYAELVSTSSLAKAISTIYTSISSSRIASVTLTPRVSISLQIPPLTSTSYLPTGPDTAYPGLWLTTADSVTPADDDTATEISSPNQVLAKHFALLLLDNEANILRDIEASAGTLGRPLAHYIRCSKPTKTFAQVSAFSGISLRDIQLLASHLVYWRRARAVPPLNQRDTYIVSPNADMSKLSIATTAYAATFPTMPSLPKMLSALSGPPRPYASLIPSKDHKESYFQILAWLLRGGWVTQLRTFAWVKVTPSVKITVQEAIKREEIEKKKFTNGNGDGNNNNKQEPTKENENEKEEEDGNTSSSSSSFSSLDSGDETPVPGRYNTNSRPGGPLNRQHSHQSAIHHPPTPSSIIHHNPNNPNNHGYNTINTREPEPLLSSLILTPHRATPLESLWLDQIISNQTHSQTESPEPDANANANADADVDPEDPHNLDPESLQKYWRSFSKYFNGKDAMEKVFVLEGLKRKVVWRVLGRMGLSVNDGPQTTGSSGGGSGIDPEERALVSVRHW